MLYSIGWTDYDPSGGTAALTVRMTGDRSDVDAIFGVLAKRDSWNVVQGADGRIIFVPADIAKKAKASAQAIEERENDEKEDEE